MQDGVLLDLEQPMNVSLKAAVERFEPEKRGDPGSTQPRRFL